MRTALFIILALTAVNAFGKIHTEYIDYKDGETALQGYLAYDDAVKGARPGVLVIHEWWGLNEYPKERAEELAKMGYVAFAIDMFGKGVVAKTADEAGKLSGAARKDPEMMRRRAQAGLKVLQDNKMVDKNKIAAIGFCFGGTVALELAESGADIKGTAAFHAGLELSNPGDAKNVKGRVLVLQGANDKFVPAEQMSKFEQSLNDGKVDWQMNLYSGAVHGFSNPHNDKDPSDGIAYNEKAAMRSWEAMKLLFRDVLGK